VPDAYTTALMLLSARELSEAQLRTRLTRRQLDPQQIDAAIQKLRHDGTLSDRRVAVAAARMESAIRHRGRGRVLQKLRQMGIDGSIAESAVSEVFEDVDENALLDRAFERRLRGKATADLDEKGRARIVRGLAAQGFAIEAILKRLRS
jgi:regulatory protein